MVQVCAAGRDQHSPTAREHGEAASPSEEHLFGDQVPNQIFPIKTLASVAPRNDDWTMHKLLPREVLFQAVNSVDQWLKSMLISKR
jgi:hypothetical protein